MKVKKFFPIMLIVFPYLLISPILISIFEHLNSIQLLSSNADRIISRLFPWSILVYLLFLVCYLLYAVFSKASAKSLAFWNMVVKLCHIPFYIFIFIFGIGVMIAIPMLWLIDVILMVTSSAFGISALVHAKREGRVTTAFTLINLVCHFLFVADVISAILVYRKLRK